MNKTIIHVDMDAFYAAVEVRDNPDLAGKPLIIGALPHERGVVSTCSYEARKFGVRSAMSIKEAYRLCPQGVYMHPNIDKYKRASDMIHRIWGSYTDAVEYVSLDEGYLDVTASLNLFGGARKIGMEIKERTVNETGLTCSVGIGYSMSSAKLASEEKKPDGFFEIPDAQAYVDLIIDRPVRIILGIGAKTAEKLNRAKIETVRDILQNSDYVKRTLGKHGRQIVDLANGIDDREVTPFYMDEAKSIGREHTFQKDINDFDYLKDVLVLLARKLSLKLRFAGLYCRTVTLKITYKNMRSITRSKSGETTNHAGDIYKVASALLDGIEKYPVRLIGISLSNFSDTELRQISLDDMGGANRNARRKELDNSLLDLQQRFGTDAIKTGSELDAENRLKQDGDEEELL